MGSSKTQIYRGESWQIGWGYGNLTIWLNVRIVLSSQTVYCFDCLWGTDRKLTKIWKACLFCPASDRASEAGQAQQVLWQSVSCIHGTQIVRWLWADGSPAFSGRVWFLAYFIYSFSDALPFFRYTLVLIYIIFQVLWVELCPHKDVCKS